MEGRARIEGVATSIHECYADCHGKKVVEDAIFKTPCVVIIFDEAPRYREAQLNFGGKQMRRTVDRDRVRGTTQTRAGCSALIFHDALGMTLRSRTTFLQHHSPAHPSKI